MFGKYLARLKTHAGDRYTLVTLLAVPLTAALGWLLPGDVWTIVGAILGFTFFALAWLWAGYLTWKDVVDQLPKPADFALERGQVSFGATVTSHDMPRDAVRFQIPLEAVNRSPDDVHLDSVEVTKLNTHASVFRDDKCRVDIEETDDLHAAKRASLPRKIDGKSRLPNLRVTIYVPLTFGSNVMKFAERLCELEDYNIELTYTFKDMTTEAQTKKIQISGSFRSYRERLVESFKADGDKHGYLEAARQGRCI